MHLFMNLQFVYVMICSHIHTFNLYMYKMLYVYIYAIYALVYLYLRSRMINFYQFFGSLLLLPVTFNFLIKWVFGPECALPGRFTAKPHPNCLQMSIPFTSKYCTPNIATPYLKNPYPTSIFPIFTNNLLEKTITEMWKTIPRMAVFGRGPMWQLGKTFALFLPHLGP